MPPNTATAEALRGGAAAPVAPGIEAPPSAAAAAAGSEAAVEAVTEVNDPAIKRIMRWGEVAARRSDKKSPQLALRELLNQLKEEGVPKSVRRSVTVRAIETGKLPRGILRKAGSKADVVTDSLKMARASLKGVKTKTLNEAFELLLRDLGEAGTDERVIQQLRKFGAANMMKHTPPKVLAAMAQRAPESGLTSVFRRVLRRPELVDLPGGVSSAVSGVEAGPEVAAALRAAKVPGFSRLGKLAGGAGKLLKLGPALTIGGTALSALLTAQDIYDIAGGRRKRAEQMAALGMTGEGQKVASAEYLRQVLESDAAIRNARLAATTREPQLTADILRVLGESGTQRGQRVLASDETAHGSAAYLNELSKSRKPTGDAVLERFNSLLGQLQQ